MKQLVHNVHTGTIFPFFVHKLSYFSGLFLGFSNGAPRDDKQISPYILDGTCSNVGSQPWMAQIQLKYAASEDNHHCGGKFNSNI